jgi:hypothetical protein
MSVGAKSNSRIPPPPIFETHPRVQSRLHPLFAGRNRMARIPEYAILRAAAAGCVPRRAVSDRKQQTASVSKNIVYKNTMMKIN